MTQSGNSLGSGFANFLRPKPKIPEQVATFGSVILRKEAQGQLPVSRELLESACRRGIYVPGMVVDSQGSVTIVKGIDFTAIDTSVKEVKKKSFGIFESRFLGQQSGKKGRTVLQAHERMLSAIESYPAYLRYEFAVLNQRDPDSKEAEQLRESAFSKVRSVIQLIPAGMKESYLEKIGLNKNFELASELKPGKCNIFIERIKWSMFGPGSKTEIGPIMTFTQYVVDRLLSSSDKDASAFRELLDNMLLPIQQQKQAVTVAVLNIPSAITAHMDEANRVDGSMKDLLKIQGTLRAKVDADIARERQSDPNYLKDASPDKLQAERLTRYAKEKAELDAQIKNLQYSSAVYMLARGTDESQVGPTMQGKVAAELAEIRQENRKVGKDTDSKARQASQILNALRDETYKRVILPKYNELNKLTDGELVKYINSKVDENSPEVWVLHASRFYMSLVRAGITGTGYNDRPRLLQYALALSIDVVKQFKASVLPEKPKDKK